jgi:hypothetical protein
MGTNKYMIDVELSKVSAGTHVAVPVGLMELLISAAFGAYDPAFGGDADYIRDAGRAAQHILNRHNRRPRT